MLDSAGGLNRLYGLPCGKESVECFTSWNIHKISRHYIYYGRAVSLSYKNSGKQAQNGCCSIVLKSHQQQSVVERLQGAVKVFRVRPTPIKAG
jgi:hypothetical protein